MIGCPRNIFGHTTMIPIYQHLYKLTKHPTKSEIFLKGFPFVKKRSFLNRQERVPKSALFVQGLLTFRCCCKKAFMRKLEEWRENSHLECLLNLRLWQPQKRRKEMKLDLQLWHWIFLFSRISRQNKACTWGWIKYLVGKPQKMHSLSSIHGLKFK